MAEDEPMIPNDLELVERVFLKIAFAEKDDQLQSALLTFLPPTLLKTSNASEDVKNKIVELLSHINKRLRSRGQIRLPTEELLNQYLNTDVALTVKNFTIIYLKMAFQREDKEVQLRLLSKFMSCLPGRPPQHQLVLLQTLLPSLNYVAYQEELSEKEELFKCMEDRNTRKFMLEYFTDVLLAPYNLELDFADPAVLPPSSLSKTAYNRLKIDPPLNKDQLEEVKMGILKYLGAQALEARTVVVPLVAASGDARHSVSNKAEHLMKLFSSSEVWEDVDVISKLFLMYQGTQPQAAMSDSVRMPANIRLKTKIFPYLLRSKLATNLNPAACLQIIFDGLFGKEQNWKIKHLAIEFCHHHCLHSSDKNMSFFAPLFYQALSKVSTNNKEEVKLRIKAFAGFSKVAKRSPATFGKDPGLIEKLFLLLEQENVEVRSAIQECVSGIASCYSRVSGTQLYKLESLILANVGKDVPHLRLASLQIANSVFPSTHVLSKYVCMLAIGDSKDDIKDEARRGLRALKGVDEGGLPSYIDVCDFLYTKMSERMLKMNSNALPFPEPVYQKMLGYINECLRYNAHISAQDEIENKLLPKMADYLKKQIDFNKIEDVFNSSIGRHLSLIQTAMSPTTGSTLHLSAVTSLLELVTCLPEHLPCLFFDKIEWLESFLRSLNDNVRDSTAQLLAIILCSLGVDRMFEILRAWIGAWNNMKFEELHGSIACTSISLARFTLLHGVQNSDFVVLVENVAEFLWSRLSDTNVAISAVCCRSIGEVAKYKPLPIPSSHDSKVSKEKVVSGLAKLVSSAPETKIKERAIVALGNICVGDAEIIHRDMIINCLLESAKIKQPEMHFTVGRALSCVGGGHQSKLSHDQWMLMPPSYETQLICADHMSPLIQRIIKECVYSHLAHVRQAAAIWLLSIVKFTPGHSAIESSMNEVQTALIDLLSDNDEVTQDVASRGLGLVYDHVHGDRKRELVSMLVDRLMSGKRAKQKVDADTEIFKPGTLGQTPDGSSLSTYKELCSLATSMNRPDLMYKFMSLASHNAMWNSRKGAAFGFLGIASFAGDELKAYLPEIIPKLYRYQYDPNVGVQRAMSNIWTALVPDGKKSVDKYTREILNDILLNITSNLWRTRQSCCLALNDLIKTCPPEDIVERLPELWELVFKVMDDIKESVRNAATIVAKTLSRLSIRLCDVNQSKLGVKAVSELLPVLLERGLSIQLPEVKSLCLETLVKVTRNAGSLLKPHITKFVVALLESLSGLEPQYLNTLSLQLSQDQEAQDKLDVIRLSASKTSPMMEAVNFCVQYIDAEILSHLVPRLCDLLKMGLGLGTKVGCTTLVISLTLHCKATISPFAGKLTNALFGGLTDHNVASKKAYASAIGHLSHYVKESTMLKVCQKLKKWYFEREDASIHHSCALAISAMSRYSSDIFYNYHAQLLPLVFIAMQERQKASPGETSVLELWEQIWNDNTSGNMSAIKLYIGEIHETIHPLITSQSWGLRKKAAAAIHVIADALGSSLCEPHLGNFIDLLLQALQGRTWDGKESVLGALSVIVVKCREGMNNDLALKVIEALVKECRKEKVDYKLKAIASLTQAVQEWKVDKFEEFKPIIEALLNKDDDDVEEENQSAKRDLITCAACEALGKLWPYQASSQQQHFTYMSTLLATRLNNSTWKTQKALLVTATAFAERTNWLEACEVWKDNNESYAERFLSAFLSEVFRCLETTQYSSVKLHALKFFTALYRVCEGCSLLYAFIKPFQTRIDAIVDMCKGSTNFDVTNGATELIKLMAVVIEKE